MGLGTFLSVYGGKSKHIRKFNGGEKRGRRGRGSAATAAVCANKKSFSSSSSSSSSSLLLLKTFDTGGLGGENEHARFPNISCQKCGGRKENNTHCEKFPGERGGGNFTRCETTPITRTENASGKKRPSRNGGDVKLSRGGGFG